LAAVAARCGFRGHEHAAGADDWVAFDWEAFHWGHAALAALATGIAPSVVATSGPAAIATCRRYTWAVLVATKLGTEVVKATGVQRERNKGSSMCESHDSSLV